MMIYVTSDQHFCHNNIIKYTGRTEFMSGHELKEYTECKNNEEKIRKLKISNESTNRMDGTMRKNWNSVVDINDVVLHLGDFALTGRQHLQELRSLLHGTIILIHGSHDRSKAQMAEAGFITVDAPVLLGEFVFSHEPLPDSVIPYGMINVHGHIHEKLTVGRRINVCVEHTAFAPVPLYDLKGP